MVCVASLRLETPVLFLLYLLSKPCTLFVTRPSSIQIGSVHYKVVYVKDLTDTKGETLDGTIMLNKKLIKIREGNETEATLIHEIIHGADPKLPEKEVQKLEQALYSALNQIICDKKP